MKTLPQAYAVYGSAFGQISSNANSPTGKYITEVSTNLREKFQSSISLGLRASGVFDALCSVYDENRTPGWDGGSAEAVSQETYRNAYLFLEALPPGIQTPSVGVEPDGHLTIEWFCSPTRLISVSISPDGFLYFSALLGLSKTNGSAPFFSDVPPIILDLIGKVYAK